VDGTGSESCPVAGFGLAVLNLRVTFVFSQFPVSCVRLSARLQPHES
jgi:hypothetical protein